MTSKIRNVYHAAKGKVNHLHKAMLHALISGGSRGIGAATAACFAQAGYAVTILYHKNAKMADSLVDCRSDALCRRLARRFKEMMDTHITGLYNITHAVLPGMISRKTGSIITVSSVWG